MVGIGSGCCGGGLLCTESGAFASPKKSRTIEKRNRERKNAMIFTAIFVRAAASGVGGIHSIDKCRAVSKNEKIL
ncbi:MAG: hypothetical protein MHMPM18_005126 [Marteilia pararefringens]